MPEPFRAPASAPANNAILPNKQSRSAQTPSLCSITIHWFAAIIAMHHLPCLFCRAIINVSIPVVGLAHRGRPV